MKLNSTAALAFLLALALLTLTACSDSAAVIATAVVISTIPEETDDPTSLFLFHALDDNHGSDLFYVGIPSAIVDEDGNAIDVTDIQSGQLVEVTYSGLVQETYPATYTDVSKIKVLGQAATDLYTLAMERAAKWEDQAGSSPASTAEPSSSASPASEPDTLQAEIHLQSPLPLSHNTITLADGKECAINIEMTNGSYSYAHDGGGTYGNNFTGSFQVRVYEEDAAGNQTELYTAPISVEGDTMTFGAEESLGVFPLIFDDYNNDGNPDFTLGQWGGSNGNIYKLFSVYPDGSVAELDTAGPMMISSFDFSVQLDKVSDTSFSKVWYDNSKGENIKTIYEWEGEKFVDTVV